MTQNRQQWAAISYPDEPRQLSPEAASRRAKVRIAVRVAKITLPVMLAAGFVAVAGSGGGNGGTSPAAAAAALFPGDKIALSVRLAMNSHGLLPKGMAVDCAGSTATAGAVSHCDEFPQSGGGGDVSFDVRFVDDHGHFSFTAPGGPVVEGQLSG